MRTSALLIAQLFAANVAAQEAPTLESHIGGDLIQRDIRIDAARMDGSSPVVWSDEISILDTLYARLLFKVEGQDFPSDAFIRIFTGLDQTTDITLADIGPDGYWSNLLPFGQARLALVSSKVPVSGALVIEQVVVQSERGALFSTFGTNDLQKINDPAIPQSVRSLAPPIAFLSFIDRGLPRTCSGFLIGENLLLTNQHCINSDETCRTMTAVFGYEFDSGNQLHMGPQIRCASFDPELANFSLDVSLVHLAGSPGPEFGLVRIEGDMPQPAGGLFIVQHPGNVPKQVSIKDCAPVDLNVQGRDDLTDFTHTCDTAGGSSGSPIFNSDGVLIGVHHFGFEEDPTGKWKQNRGVDAKRIGAWAASVLGTNGGQ